MLVDLLAVDPHSDQRRSCGVGTSAWRGGRTLCGEAGSTERTDSRRRLTDERLATRVETVADGSYRAVRTVDCPTSFPPRGSTGSVDEAGRRRRSCSRTDRTASARSARRLMPARRRTTRLPLRQARRAELLRGDVQEAFPNGWVIPEKESADGEPLPHRVARPAGDGHVPPAGRRRQRRGRAGVDAVQVSPRSLHAAVQPLLGDARSRHRPTAGYPVDAKRFFAEIKPAMAKLGLTDDQVWRKK